MTDTDLRPDAPGDVVAPDPPQGGYTEDEQYHAPEPWKPVRYPALRFGALIAALAVVGWQWPWVLVVILGLIFMIFMHELGHFVMARRADMKVTEFFIGFGPRIWSFKRGEVEYGLKVLPAGAYVKIIGMTNLEEVPPEDEARAYRQKTCSQRVKVAVAGSTMHFIMAFVLIFLLLTVVGVPGGKVSLSDKVGKNWKVGAVYKGSAAAEAGMQPGDKVLAIGGKKVTDFEGMRDIVTPLKNKEAAVSYLHDGRVVTRTVTLHGYTATSDGESAKACCLGVGAPKQPVSTVGPLAAIPATFQGFGEIAGTSVTGFAHLLSPSGISGFAHQVVGATDKSGSGSGSSSGSTSPTPQSDLKDRPVSIVGIVNLGSQFGSNGSNAVAALMLFFALINIFIGLFNLIPLLPFDGGHVAIAVYEKIQERRLHRRRYFVDAAKLLPMTYVVVGLLGLLFVSTVYLDILNPIRT